MVSAEQSGLCTASDQTLSLGSIAGEGLSYTSFEHSLEAPARIETAHFASRRDLSLHTLTRINATTLTVASRNTGRRDGDEVILVFAAPPNAGVDGAPLKSLVAFERISLVVGASARTELAVGAQHVALARPSGDGTLGVERAVATGAWRFWVGPHGQADAVSVEVR